MNVFIKSFNRPYYLDRCIQSILLNVIDADLSIIVLDDGTNPKYLKKIKVKYPSVAVKLSPFYDEKVQKIDKCISEGGILKGLEIPTQFWLSSINDNKEDYFILLEDDFWFIDKINISSTERLMKLQNMCILKLFYFGNPRLISGNLTEMSSSIYQITPKFLTRNAFLFKKFILGNPFRIKTILGILGVKNMSLINYYTIYHVAGAIFSKKYYTHLWGNFTGVVNEGEQLIKALDFYNTEKSVKYGVVKQDLVKTSFSSSATNMFKNINFNVFIYNDILNKAWLNDELDVMSGYPNDIPEEVIRNILEKNQNKSALPLEWQKWVNSFKDQYRKVGHSIS